AGAGNGIGRGVALGLAHAGARVVVNDFGVTVDGRDPSSAAAQAVVKEIEALGGEAIGNAESVATMAGGQSIVDAALARFGDLHIVVCCAGILRERMIFNMTEAAWGAGGGAARGGGARRDVPRERSRGPRHGPGHPRARPPGLPLVASGPAPRDHEPRGLDARGAGRGLRPGARSGSTAPAGRARDPL